MFGYVKTFVPQLRVCEHEYYKGTYCGLCKAMGGCTGQCSRLALSYDFVIFSLMRFALTKETVSFEQKRCVLHPLKKRNVMKKNAQLCHSAFCSALLTYHKVKDDIADERFFKRLRSRLILLPFATAMRRRALGASDKYKELDGITKTRLCELSQYEKDTARFPSVDEPAGIFGEILGEFLSFDLDADAKRLARKAGRHLGKWIYIADALDDAIEDKKLERFNPFLRMYKDIPTYEQARGVADALKNELSELEAALDLFDFSHDTTAKNILYNTIYIGMPKRIDEITDKFNNENIKNRKDT